MKRRNGSRLNNSHQKVSHMTWKFWIQSTKGGGARNPSCLLVSGVNTTSWKWHSVICDSLLFPSCSSWSCKLSFQMNSICSLIEETVFLPPIFHVNVRWELLCRFWQVMVVLSAAPILEKLVQTILGVIHKHTLHCGCIDETTTIQSLIGILERLYGHAQIQSPLMRSLKNLVTCRVDNQTNSKVMI
jgi:hypothetical protein